MITSGGFTFNNVDHVSLGRSEGNIDTIGVGNPVEL